MAIKNFKQYIIESKNKHLEHLEDTILLNGSDGGREAINFLRSLRDMLAGHSDDTVSVTVKWDGAPSIVAGINPENGKFFVGTKGAFAQNPKLMYTNETYGSSGVSSKLKAALKYLPELGYNGVFQGDFLFTPDDLETTNIDGEQYITFQPNTIVYAAPIKSQLAKEIKATKFGFVVHTKYTGDSIANLKASFGLKVSEFKQSRNVWLKDASYQDVSGNATFNKTETKEINELLSLIGKVFNQIDGSILNKLKTDEELRILLMTYNNTKVRAGERITDTKAHAKGFIDYIKTKYQKEIDKLKKEDAKQKRINTMNSELSLTEKNLEDLSNLFLLQNLVVSAKEMILDKLNQVQGVHTFVQTTDGYRVTNPEGFVVSDRIGNTRKLVDRLEFSFQNFNAIKKWTA